MVKWLRDELGFIKSSADTLEIARSVTDSGGVYVVPAFTGMGAPYWSMDARGTIFGLTRGSGSAHIVRAALESIAYQSADVISAMEKDVGVKLGTLKVDGGASANDFLVQFQADISELTAVRTASCEATARGAAALAGLTLGFYKSREEIAALPTNMEFFAPKMAAEEREARLYGWHKAVDAALYWAEK